jgi:hypothetical protein
MEGFEEEQQEPAPAGRRPSPFSTTRTETAAPAASSGFSGQVLNMGSGKQEVVLFHAKSFDDTARAADIEAASWALTRRLVEDGEAAPLTPPALAPAAPLATVPPSAVPSALAPLGAPVPEARTTPIPTAPSMVASTPTASLVAAATSATPAETVVARGVVAYLEGGVTPTAVARALGLPEALLADKINEAFLVDYGDVLLEPSSDGYQLIEDYRKEAEEWLKTLRK